MQFVEALRPLKTADGLKVPGDRFRTEVAEELLANDPPIVKLVKSLAPRKAAPAPQPKTTVTPQPQTATKMSLPPWPMKISPERYLKRHPTGKHAQLAKQLVGE